MRKLFLGATLGVAFAAHAWDVEHDVLAWLDSGTGRFCVVARKGNVTWLPVYMLSPFLFSTDTKLDFGALRLDSFATKVLLSELDPRRSLP